MPCEYDTSSTNQAVLIENLLFTTFLFTLFTEETHLDGLKIDYSGTAQKMCSAI